MRQTSLHSGNLLAWTKVLHPRKQHASQSSPLDTKRITLRRGGGLTPQGFQNTTGVGADIVALLSTELQKRCVASVKAMVWGEGFLCGGSCIHHPADARRAVHRSINMHVQALLNDTVGTLAAGHYQRPSTLFSIILGTGDTRRGRAPHATCTARVIAAPHPR
jgi:hexokinase